MEKSMQLFSLTIFIIMFLTECKKESKPYQPVQICSNLSTNLDTIVKYLPGKWQWVESRFSERGFGNTYTNPSQEGYNSYITVQGDTISFSKTLNLSTNSPLSELPVINKFVIRTEGQITNVPTDADIVLITYNLNSGIRDSYYRIAICQNYLVLYLSYRFDGLPDKIYRRI